MALSIWMEGFTGGGGVVSSEETDAYCLSKVQYKHTLSILEADPQPVIGSYLVQPPLVPAQQHQV